MSLLSRIEHEQVELELDLLIREAHRRRRRRQLRMAALTLAAVGSIGVATAAANGWLAGLVDSGAARGPSAQRSAASCPASPARMVSNATFAATVIGDGPVRLGIGNVYSSHPRRVFVYHRKARGWGGIEAIWVVTHGVHEPVAVRGFALERQGPIDVASSDGGQAPGATTLTLSGPSEEAPNPSYPASVYAGALWVRAGGCYAIDVSARGLRERLVLDVAMRTDPYRPSSGGS